MEGEKLTAGLGFTVIIYVSATLEQPLAVAIIEIVPVIGAVPLLVGVNTGIFPAPGEARPTETFEFTQLKIVPPNVPSKITELERRIAEL